MLERFVHNLIAQLLSSLEHRQDEVPLTPGEALSKAAENDKLLQQALSAHPEQRFPQSLVDDLLALQGFHQEKTRAEPELR